MKQDLKSSLFRIFAPIARDINRRTGVGRRLPRRSTAAFRKSEGQVVAWHHTKAYGRPITGIASINVNLRGREPCGIVETGQEYEQIREEVIDKLRSLRDPQTGEVVMAEVYRNNEIYWGQKLGKMPDIVGVPKPRYSVVAGFLAESVFADLSSRRGGGHFAQPNGILVAYGPHIKSGENIEGARLIDIAPTVLHIMGLPVPQDMDGRVLQELFREEGELAQRKVIYQQVDIERERVQSKIADLKRLGKI